MENWVCICRKFFTSPKVFFHLSDKSAAIWVKTNIYIVCANLNSGHTKRQIFKLKAWKAPSSYLSDNRVHKAQRGDQRQQLNKLVAILFEFEVHGWRIQNGSNQGPFARVEASADHYRVNTMLAVIPGLNDLRATIQGMPCVLLAVIQGARVVGQRGLGHRNTFTWEGNTSVRYARVSIIGQFLDC